MNRTEDNILKQIKKFNRNRNIGAISRNMLLKEDLRLDSISLVSLLTSLGRDLNIDIAELSDDELQAFGSLKSVDDLILLLTAKVAG